MEPTETTTISGRIVAEFEDDAGPFLSGAAEFVEAPETTPIMPATTVVPPPLDTAQGKSS